MKRKISKVVMLGLAIFLLCGFTNGAVINNARVEGWNSGALITNVDINFDKISVSDITEIEFKLSCENGQTTKAVSQGENLQNLLKYCSTFWGENRSTYQNVKGIRTLTCKFNLREKAQDNGYWERESFTCQCCDCALQVTIKTTSREYSTLSK